MKRKRILIVVAAVIAAVLLGFLLIPGIGDKLGTRAEQARIRLFYWAKPPEADVFNPQEQSLLDDIVQSTMQALASPSPTAIVTAAEAVPPTPTLAVDVALPTHTPMPTATPLPPMAQIADVPYIDQHYGQNNCAPANLAMALTFWGWDGKREQISQALKPFERDKNVMPYELADYVNTNTSLNALARFGGTPQLLKSLIAAGYPVIVERGVRLRDLSGKVSWMGHYGLVYGYDDGADTFDLKDPFEAKGDHFTLSDEAMLSSWRAFNYAYVVVYPAAEEAKLAAVLGDAWEAAAADRAAYETASKEIYMLQGQDLFFAWFNRGSSLVRLQDYVGAAQAYDDAFAVYAELESADRPWRIMWYQTGPYFAYYYTARYADVLRLADQTLDAAVDPFLEENYYWRGRARQATGDLTGAIEDYRESLKYHPDFAPSVDALSALGETP